MPPSPLKHRLQYRFVVVAGRPSSGQRRINPVGIYQKSRDQQSI
jgi:hypothetical protein